MSTNCRGNLLKAIQAISSLCVEPEFASMIHQLAMICGHDSTERSTKHYKSGLQLLCNIKWEKAGISQFVPSGKYDSPASYDLRPLFN